MLKISLEALYTFVVKGMLTYWPVCQPTLRNRSAIIRFLASKSLSFMLLGVPGLNKILMRIVALLAACAITVSCGSYKSPTVNGHKVSGLKFRAFVSNPLLPVGGGRMHPW